MHIGIIGLPSSGKTLVFQTLTQSDSSGTRAGGKSETRVVAVPDHRLETLAAMYMPRKVTPATIAFVDPQIVGQTGTQYVESLLPLMRDADALVHVVRAFDNPAVPHPAGSVDAARDHRQLNSELLLADLGVVERRIERLSKDLRKMKDPELASEHTMLLRCLEALENEQPIRQLTFSEDEQKRLRGFGLLSSKAQLVGLNLDESAIQHESERVAQFQVAIDDPALEVIPIYGSIESEIAQLPAGEAKAFLDDLGLQQTGLDRFVQASYHLLNLCSFFTAGEKEVRAWTITRGCSAQQAAGVIHSDLARGFIRAEVTHYDDLTAAGSMAKARDAGKLRLEGKTYPVKDGDVMLIRFNV
jgi:GTP-binding protein YchF